MKRKLCVVCGVEFEPRSGRGILCSDACRTIRHTLHDAAAFNRLKNDPAKYEEYRAQRRAKYNVPKVYRLCAICGNNFLPHHYRAITCSESCRSTYLKAADRLRRSLEKNKQRTNERNRKRYRMDEEYRKKTLDKKSNPEWAYSYRLRNHSKLAEYSKKYWERDAAFLNEARRLGLIPNGDSKNESIIALRRLGFIPALRKYIQQGEPQ